MSMRPGSIPPVPDETARVARAAFPKGSFYLRLRDELGAIYEDKDFAALFPARPRPSWQSKVEGAYSDEDFQIDWEKRQARCPQGHTSGKWHESQRKTGEPFVVIRFRGADCKACPARALCTRAKTDHASSFSNLRRSTRR
jgi:hypothetical protein